MITTDLASEAPVRPVQSQLRAVVFISIALFFATAQDALVKLLQSGYPTWEAVAFRGASATPLFIAWLLARRLNPFQLPPQWKLVYLRALILFSGYMAFALSISTLPLANAVAIYFTMPFFVGALSPWALKEHVPAYRWIAIAVGFCGVLVGTRPGHDTFQPAALLALYSAFAYALGQMLSRHLALKSEPLLVANAQSLLYFAGAVIAGLIVTIFGIDASSSPTFAAMTQPAHLPPWEDLRLMLLVGLFSAISSVMFVRAYQAAPASFVAPMEYLAIIAAVSYDFLWFNHAPELATLAGAAIVIGAGIFILVMDRRRHKIG